MHPTPYFRKIFPGLLLRLEDILFPPRCPVCEELTRQGQRIHPACRKLLEFSDDPVCLRCGRRILSPRQEYCSQCRKKQPLFDRGKSLLVYQGPVRETMYRFKYANRREYALFFADLAMELQGDWIRRISPECIIPVPMYARKQRGRGYNQAEVFAGHLSEKTGIPVEKRAVFRIRSTRPLKLMNAAERQKELEGAFAAGDFASRYGTVLLVDDIYTTGSTADAVTAVLKQAGVRRVYVLSVCCPMGNE